MRAWEAAAAPAVRVWLGGEGAGNGGASSHGRRCRCSSPYPHCRVEWNSHKSSGVVRGSVCLCFLFFFLGERLPLLVCCLPEAMVSLQDLCVRVLGWALYLGPNPSYRPVATSSCPNPISSLSMAVACCHLVW